MTKTIEVTKDNVHNRIIKTLLEINHLERSIGIEEQMNCSELAWVISNFTSGHIEGFHGTAYKWTSEGSRIVLTMSQD